jgi:hypothetical protein
MKAHTLSSKSWHFWLANFGDRRVWDDDRVDICSYTRYVIKGFLLMLLAGLGILLLTLFTLTIVGGTLLWYYELIVAFKWVTPNPPAVVGTLCLLIAAFAYTRQYLKSKKKNREPSPPGFVSLVSTKVKSKTCFMINFNTESSK